MRALVWFRADLRVRDNRALHFACQEATRGVVAVFAVCPRQWQQHDWGSAKVDFLLRNVEMLSSSLRKLNIPLLIARADTFNQVPAGLLQIARRHGCSALCFNEEYEVNEKRRDRAVQDLFTKHGLPAYAFSDQTVFAPDVFHTNAGGWYTVFTPFKRKWCDFYRAVGGVSLLPKPKRQAILPIQPDSVPDRLPAFPDETRADLWPAGEEHALARLQEFIAKRLGTYEKTRDLPALDGTSMLSPYLAAGVVSARQCLKAVVDANAGRVDSGRKGATTWITELIWREFYRHVLVGFPRVCKNLAFREETEQLPWRYDEEQFQAWCEGRTGVPIVDAGMRQLKKIAWMHNRLRMIVATFLVKDLLIDWRWGERYFSQNLVDADFASNNGGWQWCASTGTDAVPYFRVFNPYSQSRKFDPDGVFIRRYVPELSDLDAKTVHEPFAAVAKRRPRLDYPRPICDHAAARRQAIALFKQVLGRKRRPGKRPPS